MRMQTKRCQASFILGISKWAVVFSGALSPVERGEVNGKAAVCAQHGVRWEGESSPGLFDPVLFALGGLKYLKSHDEKLTFVP